MARPRVSVICIFYNAQRFFREALDSVLAQDFPDYEFILADDGSTDTSTAIARELATRFPDRVRYVEHPGHENRGMSATRNLGLSHSSGEYVAFIDADDHWRPEKLSRQVAIMDARPDVGVLCGTVNYWQSWEGGEDRLVPTGWSTDTVSRPPDTTLKLYPFGSADAPCPSDAMIRRAVVDQVGGFEAHFTGPLQMYEDQAFFAKVWLVTEVFFSSEVWLDYRLSADSCVASVRRENLHGQVQAYFIDWFLGYLAGAEVNGKDRIERALAGLRWRNRHPLAARIEKRLRRLLR